MIELQIFQAKKIELTDYVCLIITVVYASNQTDIFKKSGGLNTKQVILKSKPTLFLL